LTFVPGQDVRVADREHDGHHRTPAYLKGRVGSVVRAHTTFTNPETRAYGSDGLPELQLYLVGFAQAELWPGYAGARSDTLYADVFEHWLEGVE
jgi:nitrile hydratase